MSDATSGQLLPESPPSRSAGIRCVPRSAPEYPERLRELDRAPDPIWVTGDVRLVADRPVVAIVGTRRATSYGLRVAREIATALSRAGACVVSGLARGVDAAAHLATLDSGGATAAVLGTGLNHVYPVAHRDLQRAIAVSGVVLSELEPDDRAHSGSFPERNRIIAALAHAVIVIEAPIKSGALGTADRAAALGRDVGAVPGPIDSPQSAGSNQLLRDGAVAITGIDDALALVSLSRAAPPTPDCQTVTEREVWNALAYGAETLDGLCAVTRLPAHDCAAAVGALELRGLVECALSGEIRRRA